MHWQRELDTLRAELEDERQLRKAFAAENDAEEETARRRPQETELLGEISQLHDEMNAERSKRDDADVRASELADKVRHLRAKNGRFEDEKIELCKRLRSLEVCGLARLLSCSYV